MGTPPRPPPFRCSRLTAKILLRRQEDLSLKIFGRRGTIGGPWRDGDWGYRPPLQTPRGGDIQSIITNH